MLGWPPTSEAATSVLRTVEISLQVGPNVVSGRRRQIVLLDEWMGESHWAERHSVWIGARPAVVFEAVQTTDLAGPWAVRALMALRAVPAVLSDPKGAWRRRRESRGPVTLRRVMGHDFARLAEEPGRELVLGLVGRFWTPTGSLVPTDAARFRQPLPPGLAQAAWNFAVEPEARDDHPGTRLTTETRVRCADEATRRNFARYWRVVRPFSGFIRMRMLGAIRREAETRPAGGVR
jgi:hypothetical protein